LIDGLSADSVVKHPEASTIFPEVKLIDFDSATEEALEKTHPAHIERVWEVGKDFGSLPQRSSDGDDSSKTSEVWVTLKHEGCFIDHREVHFNGEPEKVFRAIKQLINKSNWLTEENEAQGVLVCVKDQIAGKKWIEWRVTPSHADEVPDGGSVTYMTQTVFFSPRGLPGFLYWYLFYPFHWMTFRGLIRSIVEQSEIQ